MISIARILLPVEFSERCRGAARYAASLACHFHAEVVLLHVVVHPRSPYWAADSAAWLPSQEQVNDALAQSSAQLEMFAEEELQGLTAKRAVVDGDPAREIVAYARREKSDVIVMPTHAYGPFRRLLLGSVTAKVLHDAECPVWTGPHLEAAPHVEGISFGKVVCAIDFGPQTRSVLGWAASLAKEFRSGLAIVHVIPPSDIKLGGFFFDPQWRTQLIKAAEDHIWYLQDDLRITGEARIEEGDVPAAVAHAAREFQADVLIIGRGHGAGVLGRLRANAYAILRESPCPVLSI